MPDSTAQDPSERFILLADDDHGILAALDRELRHLGAGLRHSSTAGDALSVIDAENPPACLISEILIGSDHASGLFEAALAADPPIPCILLTGYPVGHPPLPDGLCECLSGVFPKPWDKSDLLAAVAAALSGCHAPDRGPERAPHP